MTMRVSLAVAIGLLLGSSLLFARDAREQQRIDFLIDSLGKLPGAVFIRNGSEYDAAKARDHLLRKLAFGGERIKTADDFIKYCASESSFSHKPYQIRLNDGRVVDTSSFFHAKLKEFDEENH